VDWKWGRIHVYGSKTDTWRWQYPSKAFMEHLQARYLSDAKEYGGCPWICHYQGRRIASLKRAWTRAKVTAKIRLYDIRHYYITYALASGADIMPLAEQVGHTTPRMLIEVYAHLAEDLRRRKTLAIPQLYLISQPNAAGLSTKVLTKSKGRPKRAA